MDEKTRFHYKLHISLLSVIGLWPYSNATFRLVQNIVCTFLLIFGILAQLATFLTMTFTTPVLLNNLSIMIMTMTYIFKYTSSWYKTERTRNIMELVNSDWKTTKEEEELKIFVEHASLGQFYTRLIIIFVYMPASALVISQFATDFLDILIPLNESRPHKFPVMVELYYDQQKHSYITAFLIGSILLLGVTCVIATQSLFIMWLQHAAGIYDIVRHLSAGWGFSYFVLVSFGVAALSISLFRLAQAFLIINDINELITTAGIVMSIFTYMFALNYVTQQVRDSCGDIFDQSYGTTWYEAPMPMQKLLLCIMSRSIKVSSIDINTLFEPSIKGFSQLARVSLSYFMTILSCQ